MDKKRASLENIVEDKEIYLSRSNGVWEMDLPNQQILSDYKKVLSSREAIQEACREEYGGFAVHYQYKPGGDEIFCTLYELISLDDNHRAYRPFATNVKVDEIENYVRKEMQRREGTQKTLYPVNDNHLKTSS